MTKQRNTEDTVEEPEVDEVAEAASSVPGMVQSVDDNQVRHLVSDIKSAEQQIGEHILTALEDSDTIAVLTAVVVGPEGQRIISAGLNADMLSKVQSVLKTAEAEREEEIPCVGFHCYLKKKKKDNGESHDAAEADSEQS